MTAQQGAPPAYAPYPYEPPAPPRPRVVVKADLLPALSVLSAVAVLGLPLGLLWAWLAPPELVFVLTDPTAAPGGVVPLMGESAHRFDGMALFTVLGLAAGLVTGAALWLLRERRGPVLLVAAALGSLIAAWLAMRTGQSFALGSYPDVVATAAAESTVPRAPVLESISVVVSQPLGLVLAYTVLVAWNGRDDLGRRLG